MLLIDRIEVQDELILSLETVFESFSNLSASDSKWQKQKTYLQM